MSRYNCVNNLLHREVEMNRLEKTFLESVDIDFGSFIDYEMCSEILSNPEYYSEAYVGTSSTLIEAEKVLDEMVTLMKNEPLKDYTNHPLNIKLTKLLEKQFGFKHVYIKWNRSPACFPMVCTNFSLDTITTGVDTISSTKSRGYYDTAHNHVCLIQASSTLPSQLNITGKEYLAIILHEIGHNFDYSPMMVLSVVLAILSKVSTPVSAGISLATTTNPGKNVINTIGSGLESILDAFPVFKTIGRGFAKLLDVVSKGLEYLLALPGLTLLPVSVLLSPAVHLFSLHIKKGEEFADSFASMYGYAVPLATALNKMEGANLLNYNKPYPKGSHYNIMTDIAMLNRYVIGTFLTGASHGHTDARIMNNIEYLRKEVREAKYPVEIQKQLENDLNNLEKTYTAYINTDNEPYKMALTSYTRALVNKVFKGRTDFIAKVFPTNTAKFTESVDDFAMESCIDDTCTNREMNLIKNSLKRTLN